MNAGPLLPTHRYGHCGFDPALTGAVCGAPAEVHLWVGGRSDPDAFTAYTCLTHAEAARMALDPLDWHQVESPCLGGPRHQWNFTGTPGESFCVDPEDDPVLAVAAGREVVVAP
jgi:hypothetical protein